MLFASNNPHLALLEQFGLLRTPYESSPGRGRRRIAEASAANSEFAAAVDSSPTSGLVGGLLTAPSLLPAPISRSRFPSNQPLIPCTCRNAAHSLSNHGTPAFVPAPS